MNEFIFLFIGWSVLAFIWPFLVGFFHNLCSGRFIFASVRRSFSFIVSFLFVRSIHLWFELTIFFASVDAITDIVFLLSLLFFLLVIHFYDIEWLLLVISPQLDVNHADLHWIGRWSIFVEPHTEHQAAHQLELIDQQLRFLRRGSCLVSAPLPEDYVELLVQIRIRIVFFETRKIRVWLNWLFCFFNIVS